MTKKIFKYFLLGLFIGSIFVPIGIYVVVWSAVKLELDEQLFKSIHGSSSEERARNNPPKHAIQDLSLVLQQELLPAAPNARRIKPSQEGLAIYVFRDITIDRYQQEFESIVQLSKQVQNVKVCLVPTGKVDKQSAFYKAHAQHFYTLANQAPSIQNRVYLIGKQTIYYSTPEAFDWNTLKALTFLKHLQNEQNI